MLSCTYLLNSGEFVTRRITETLSDSSLLKDTFKRGVLKDKQIGEKENWEYERKIKLEKNKRQKLEKKVEQYRSSIADIETSLILDEVEDKELSLKIKENIIQKFNATKKN
jgi:septal ring factor EnvC (AmiA/AmiB activator)